MRKNIYKKLWAIALVFLISSTHLSADVVYPWDKGNNKVFVHFSNKTVAQVLKSFCEVNSCNLNIDSSNDVSYLAKKVNGNFSFNNKTELLNFLSDQYGFSWFFYHGILYIGSNAYAMDIITIPPEYLQNLQDNLLSVGLFNPKFGWAVNSENSTIIISGPPMYNKLIMDFTKNFAPLPHGNDFVVIKLRYANAADVTLNLNGKGYTIPGITTIINNLTNPYIMQEYQGSFQYSPQSTVLLKNLVNGYKGDPAIQSILGAVSSPATPGSGNNNSGSSAGSNAPGGNGTNAQSVMTTFPIVQSDVRNNSVVIFDKAANLPMYEKLVHYLDVPQKMIQINTTIIDLDEDKLNTKGVNWLAALGGNNFGFNANNLAATNNSLSFNSAPGQTLINANNLDGLITNVNFLSQNGAAKIQATPSIITLLEMPALLTFNTQLTFYQGPNSTTGNGVGGNSSPSQVNATSSIVITPHKIDESSYRLEITLQAQQVFDQDNTSSYPIINGGTIQTQAVVGPGQGLILGGYDQDKQVKFVSKVPFFGDIPLVGWFFKNEVIKNVRIKRMYLITINLIDVNKK